MDLSNGQSLEYTATAKLLPRNELPEKALRTVMPYFLKDSSRTRTAVDADAIDVRADLTATHNKNNQDTAKVELTLTGSWIAHVESSGDCVVNGQVYSKLDTSPSTDEFATLTINTVNNTQALYVPNGLPTKVECSGVSFLPRVTTAQAEADKTPFYRKPTYANVIVAMYTAQDEVMDMIATSDLEVSVYQVDFKRLPCIKDSTAKQTIQTSYGAAQYGMTRTFNLYYPAGAPHMGKDGDEFHSSAHCH